jgi:Zn-dependent M28 family amino/carboxypeptidase
MPGASYREILQSLSAEQNRLRSRLQQHVDQLSVQIGERHVRRYDKLQEALGYICEQFRQLGYQPQIQEFLLEGIIRRNAEIEIPGSTRPQEIVVIGAHYDTAFGAPGADDNATGVAALLEIVRSLQGKHPARTIRFVVFDNEETPTGGSWQTAGSYAYAKRCHERGENITAMLSLEMLGVYSDAEGSQKYPSPFNLFYPTIGNFIGFVGDMSSRALVHRCIGSFRRHCQFPSEGVAAPNSLRDISRSDHNCFWMFGYQALMVTDTSNFRYLQYHTAEDTPDKINFDCFARVTGGLSAVVEDLAN